MVGRDCCVVVRVGGEETSAPSRFGADSTRSTQLVSSGNNKVGLAAENSLSGMHPEHEEATTTVGVCGCVYL